MDMMEMATGHSNTRESCEFLIMKTTIISLSLKTQRYKNLRGMTMVRMMKAVRMIFVSIFSASEEDGALKCWIVPYTTLEPSLNPEELVKLDLLADAVEIEKLKDMKVLNKPRNQRVLALKLAKVSWGRLRSTALLMV